MKFLLLLFFFPFSGVAQENIPGRFYHEKIGNEMQIFADNPNFAPISLEYQYTADNMISTLPDKSVIVVPALAKKFEISTVKTANAKLKSSFSYDIAFVMGDVNLTNYEESYSYSLPFAKQKSYSVYQGYNGLFSHKNALSIDFSLKEKDQVVAAREGIVIEVADQNFQSCGKIECAKFNNKIVIMHSDGTFAEYVHLLQNGSAVKVGDIVTKDQLIAYSGNTGFTKGPHLHFSVFINNIDGTRRYFRTLFKTSKSVGEFLIEKKIYTKNY